MKDKLNLILMVDTSGSMKGKAIGAVNDAALNVIQAVDCFAQNESMDCTISILDYSNGASVSNPVNISEFIWSDAHATGETSFGKACVVLLNHLDSKCRHYERKNDRDLIVLISDGTSTDDYTANFCQLMESSSFQRAERICISIGSSYDEGILNAFASRRGSIMPSDTLEDLRSILINFRQSMKHKVSMSKILTY